MVVWLDAQLPPALAPWLSSVFGVEAHAVRVLGLLHATDSAIFNAARDAGVVVLTKDGDFVVLLERYGPPPQVVWLTCGNTSTASLRTILQDAWVRMTQLLETGVPLVEISGRRK